MSSYGTLSTRLPRAGPCENTDTYIHSYKLETIRLEYSNAHCDTTGVMYVCIYIHTWSILTDTQNCAVLRPSSMALRPRYAPFTTITGLPMYIRIMAQHTSHARTHHSNTNTHTRALQVLFVDNLMVQLYHHCISPTLFTEYVPRHVSYNAWYGVLGVNVH